jgi:hypothetical protein
MVNVPKVFISSTFEDLIPEREKVIYVLNRLHLFYNAMEFFGARTDKSLETCLMEIKQSDIYIGILGHKYGSKINKLGISYTEFEYNEATKLELPRLIYMKDPNIPILPTHIESNPENAILLNDFVKKLKTNHTIAYFKSPEDLALQIVIDLSLVLDSLKFPANVEKPEYKDKNPNRYEYDVAISFAGSDRIHASKLADAMEKYGLKVFYDRNYEADLWGQNLYERLHKIYSSQSLYIVLLISGNLAMKNW